MTGVRWDVNGFHMTSVKVALWDDYVDDSRGTYSVKIQPFCYCGVARMTKVFLFYKLRVRIATRWILSYIITEEIILILCFSVYSRQTLNHTK